MAGELKGRKGENEPLYGRIIGEKSNDAFPSEQALLTSRNISAVIVIISVAKYTNHVAEDNFFFKKQHCHPCVANWV